MNMDIITTIPYVHSTGQINAHTLENTLSCNEKYLFRHMLSFYNDLQHISFINLWNEICSNSSKRFFVFFKFYCRVLNIFCSSYESLNVLGKVQTVLRLIYHITNCVSCIFI